MTNDKVLEGLNPEQLRAVETVRGPVCILAGAGSGKTTTITRRIANQVVSGEFVATQILAVTFTTKAADELKTRIEELGVPAVPARTFHSAAYAQLNYFMDKVHPILESKYSILGPIVRSLPKPYNARSIPDIVKEVAWAKNVRLSPDTYLDGLKRRGHEPPIPSELMKDVFREYERRKEKAGKIDFEDQLELTIRMYEADESKLAEFRERYCAFTVDEYQDVNLLQQTLLELWLGEREDLCVVGDDYQSIYGFTGATPEYLLAVPKRYPNAAVIRLEQNYRSTPEILSLANRLTPKLGGSPKILHSTMPSGIEPVVTAFDTNESEATSIATRVKTLHERGVPLREIAVLYRVNFRSPVYETALLRAGMPYQVKEGAFLERRAAKTIVPLLERRGSETPIIRVVKDEAHGAGYQDIMPSDLGPAEITFQNDLALMIDLAREFDGEKRRVSDFIQHIKELFESQNERDAVQLMTYHSAKGLEFKVVFLPQVEDREIPYWRAVEENKVQEERRLFYVGLTRAKSELHISWPRGRERSRFLDEIFPHEVKSQGRVSDTRKTNNKRNTRNKFPPSKPIKSGLSPKSWLPDWMR